MNKHLPSSLQFVGIAGPQSNREGLPLYLSPVIAGFPSPANTSILDAKKSIKEKTVTCLECGKVMKIITKKHLALHNLDAVSYREKYGLKKGTPLACKELQRKRKDKMKDMRLWERRADKRKIDFGSIEDL